MLITTKYTKWKSTTEDVSLDLIAKLRWDEQSSFGI